MKDYVKETNGRRKFFAENPKIMGKTKTYLLKCHWLKNWN